MPDSAESDITQKPNDRGKQQDTADLSCDIAVVGGGIAGLWLLKLLSNRGYNVLLCEQQTLGHAQSLASQGMIHGGIKYALGAKLTGASEAISRMPERWRECLRGEDDVDLRGVSVVADEYHMWSDGALGKLGSFFASHALRGRVDALKKKDYPEVFQHEAFTGTLHRLHDLVLDVPSLLTVLAEDHRDQLLKARVTDTHFDRSANLQSLGLENGQTVLANQFVFAAGAGNSIFSEALRHAGHSHAPATQLRPLHQSFVRHNDLQELYAHCLTGIKRPEPRLTITTHPVDAGIGWYIGGQLATDGVKRSEAEQIQFTTKELTATLPWIDWSSADISTLRIDRAEPQQTLGNKPDEACVVRCGNALLCWPTKLSLTPDLGDQVLNAIDPPVALPRTSKTTSTIRSKEVSEKTSTTSGPLSVAQPPWIDQASGEH